MASGENIEVLDLAQTELRAVNARLQGDGEPAGGFFRVINPRGAHALACGLDSEIEVEIEGHTGYYCAGMNQKAKVVIKGNAGQGVAENMMSGEVRVTGDVSQSAGATAHGGLLVIEGNAAARCGISLKGGDIVVKGNVGHMSMFMAQAGTLVVLGDAGDALGDSLYEAQIYVRGSADNLGADCIEKEMRDEHREQLYADCSRPPDWRARSSPSEFRRYGSARRELYQFQRPTTPDAY